MFLRQTEYKKCSVGLVTKASDSKLSDCDVMNWTTLPRIYKKKFPTNMVHWLLA
ncbi:hypothetical protein RO3G_11483 [Rhizopus delemar RA 99-880]|uniref:Uncharacterized protein n=1 Tax=Rhizopus delemar (strain RA 99-880 / ATCC MYA-4621 / FGSC 9543 / NRRL 43880) TaxID=246409 RepID=I1CE92_RHIO9|nr:hypothetical protein RO3G_11483 [Rhizopus delemar RA 99-880]|eukprot:EIE86772.1 hypothetical protein RO3G_11483 [Rhizopus delemar RA 99-880]